MDSTHEYVESTGNTKLYLRRWQSVQPKQGSLLIVHGAGEHSGRYVHVGKFFAEAGWEVLAFDLRGHGKSGGKRGYIARYEDFAQDLKTASAALGNPKDQIVFAHSFGGQIALWSISKQFITPAGLIASAPWLTLEHPPSFPLKLLAKFLYHIAPQTPFPTGINDQKISSDIQHLNSLEDLNLGLSFIRIHTFYETEKAAAHIKSLTQFDCPLLLTHGTADPIVSLEANRQFFNQIQAPKKELKLYEGLLHELHNETNRSIVLNDYLNWARNI
jgi:alpha-beta hydrolase superfamily lysophospholipase